jgi:hypothetical protein
VIKGLQAFIKTLLSGKMRETVIMIFIGGVAVRDD